MTRLLIALVGAAVITSGMLLGMSEVTQKFRDRDTTRYFRIVDFLPAPDGRRRLRRPTQPDLPPKREDLPYEQSIKTLPVDRPAVHDDARVENAVAAPDIVDESRDE